MVLITYEDIAYGQGFNYTCKTSPTSVNYRYWSLSTIIDVTFIYRVSRT